MTKFFEKSNLFKKIKSIKHIEIYISIIFILILLALYFVDFSGKKDTVTTEASLYSSTYDYSNYLESKLEKVLSNIKDAGKVSVMVSLESSSEKIYATSSEEKNNLSNISSGKTSSTTTTTEPVIISVQGTATPIVVKEYLPKVNGIIVVAEGAKDIGVRLELLKAVQAILDVPTTNIEILVGNK